MPDTDFDGSSDIFKLKNKLYFPLILLLLLQLLKLYFDCKNSKEGGMAFFPFFVGGRGGGGKSLYGALDIETTTQRN